MKPAYKLRLSEELKQKQAVSDSLINKILYSKRLLIDHVDALERCMLYMKESPHTSTDETDKATGKKLSIRKFLSDEIFTGRNTCLLLGTTILEHFIIPKSLKLALIPSIVLTGGFGTMYTIKKIFVFRNKIVERELDSLIRTIDEFGNCIRRNMTYFNEIIVMKQHELIESRQIERAWDCITSAKEVTEILYDATRKLEKHYPIPARYSEHYSPMEELRDCEYFKNNVTDYSPKHIKDFHNIFAYVQSQFLLRLALTIATKPSISRLNAELTKIDCQISQLVQEEENHFKNLAIDLNKKKQIEVEELAAAKAMQNRSGPIAVLQDSSLKLSACMVAVAGECQALDITLQRLTAAEAEHKDNAKQLVEVANNMRSIENALTVCFDDFQRLMLVYNKFLNSKLLIMDEQHNNAKHANNKNVDNEFPESFLRVEISQNPAPESDDFYAYIFDENEAKQEQGTQQKPHPHDLEILNFEKRITKGKFRPVLQQLKDRIDPIRKDMLEKERQILAAKGINVDELFKPDINGNDDLDEELEEEKAKSEILSSKKSRANNNNPREQANTIEATNSGSDSEGSANLEFKRQTKRLKERDNFAEMRNFLAQKSSENQFKMDASKLENMLQATVKHQEEILESDC